MAQKYMTVTNLIDDCICYATKSQADATFDALYSLLVELGFTLSKQAACSPYHQMCLYLGMEIDTENFTISIPEEKLSYVRNGITWSHALRGNSSLSLAHSTSKCV